MSRRVTLAEVEAWVDHLDRAEPSHSNWRHAYDKLAENLAAARKARLIPPPLRIALFLVLIAFLVVTFTLGVQSSIWFWVVTANTVVGLIVSAWEIRTEAQFPILKLEGRIAALLKYYGANDIPQGEKY